MNAEEFYKRYPDLKNMEVECHQCGEYLQVNVLFADEPWAGIRSDECKCGGPGAQVLVPLTKEVRKIFNFMWRPKDDSNKNN